MKEAAFSTDYLVIGAGLTGLCFADEILRRSRAHITIVDKRHAPGGHWNEVYPFVKLHQPSAFYGVESTTLGNTRIDNSGPNKGFSSLATGPEITAYCHAVMNDRLLPGGRVTYLPMTEHLGGGAVRGLLSGKVTNITIRKKLVDASYYTNSIPLTHRREFQTAPTVTCVPPNDLPRLASEFEHFTILGGGKTGIDTCIWLIESGVSPERIRWIIPRDQWFVNRAKVQPADSRFFDVFGGFADSRDDIAAAASPDDLAKRHEQSGVWLRLSQEVWPVMFHAAHISQAEIDALNQIEDVVRLGRVSHISGNRLTLANGKWFCALNPATSFQFGLRGPGHATRYPEGGSGDTRHTGPCALALRDARLGHSQYPVDPGLLSESGRGVRRRCHRTVRICDRQLQRQSGSGVQCADARRLAAGMVAQGYRQEAQPRLRVSSFLRAVGVDSCGVVRRIVDAGLRGSGERLRGVVASYRRRHPWQ
jgi:hypothetical protein